MASSSDRRAGLSGLLSWRISLKDYGSCSMEWPSGPWCPRSIIQDYAQLHVKENAVPPTRYGFVLLWLTDVRCGKSRASKCVGFPESLGTQGPRLLLCRLDGSDPHLDALRMAAGAPAGTSAFQAGRRGSGWRARKREGQLKHPLSCVFLETPLSGFCLSLICHTCQVPNPNCTRSWEITAVFLGRDHLQYNWSSVRRKKGEYILGRPVVLRTPALLTQRTFIFWPLSLSGDGPTSGFSTQSLGFIGVEGHCI